MKIALYIIFFLFPPFLFADSFGTINGFVTDANNGESLPYVNVFLLNSQIGTTTNDMGYYIIHNIPPREYTLVFSMMGYKRKEQTILVKMEHTEKYDAALEADIIEMESIIKTAERERFEREVEISTNTLNARQLSSLPMLAEADVFRTLRLLPGVISRNDFSSQLYVRGGSPDQNLVLLDGVAVYNPFHLLGLFSMFNTDAVKEIEFISGGFPVEFGERLSSVLNITNNEGNSKKFQGHLNISMLSAKATLQGPVPSGSYLISARRTYFDQVLKGSQYELPYYFYDFQGKINVNINNNHKLTFSGFYGDDKLDFDVEPDDDEDFSVVIDWLWGNRTSSLKWRWLVHPNLFSDVLLTRSNFTLDLDLELVGENIASLLINNGIKDYSLKADFNYFAFNNHSIKFGAKHSWLDFLYSISIDNNRLFNYNSQPTLSSIYIQDQFQFSKKLSFKGGLRLDQYNLGNRTTFSPQLGIKYQLFPNFAIKGSLGLYHQFLTTASSDNQNYSFMDLWFPLQEMYKPLNALHCVGGIEWWLPYDLVLSFELYFKNMNHLLELNENGDFSNPDDDFFIGHGRASGFEMLLKKSIGSFTGWLGYSYSLTKRTMNELTFYPKHDRRHNLNLVLNYDLGRNWTVGFIFTYGTGLPFTPVLGKYAHFTWNFHENQKEDEIYNRLGAKNSARYPAYHRMDFSIRKKWELWGLVNYPYLQIVNIYNRNNVFFYFWDHDKNPSAFKSVPMFPLLPTLGIEFDF